MVNLGQLLEDKIIHIKLSLKPLRTMQTKEEMHVDTIGQGGKYNVHILFSQKKFYWMAKKV